MNETVAAVVVTYNRKQLLTECLDALLAQSRPVDKILLIDNASTDGTPELLREYGYLDNPVIDYVRLPENTGGAGGFYEGVKRGYEAGYDWVWLMDDDTIASSDCLAELVKAENVARNRFKIGYIASRVTWNNGEIHLMNIPDIQSMNHDIPFNEIEDMSLLVIRSCSFVSTLLSRKAIFSCGLPMKEMFIWGDDVEFFRRISSSEFIGFYCNKSVANHKTSENHNTNIFIDGMSNLWKYKFGIRNDMYLTRVEKGFLYFVARFIYSLTIRNMKIYFNRDSGKITAIKINTLSTVSSLFFYPKIERIDIITSEQDAH